MDLISINEQFRAMINEGRPQAQAQYDNFLQEHGEALAQQEREEEQAGFIADGAAIKAQEGSPIRFDIEAMPRDTDAQKMAYHAALARHFMEREDFELARKHTIAADLHKNRAMPHREGPVGTGIDVYLPTHDGRLLTAPTEALCVALEQAGIKVAYVGNGPDREQRGVRIIGGDSETGLRALDIAKAHYEAGEKI